MIKHGSFFGLKNLALINADLIHVVSFGEMAVDIIYR